MRWIPCAAFAVCFAISGGASAIQSTVTTGQSGAANAVPTSPGTAAAQAAPRLNFAVYGSSKALVTKLKTGLATRFQSAGVDITGKFPTATLVLYAIQDVDSNVNKSGVTVAVAYISNSLTARFAVNYIKKHGKDLPPYLIAMIRQDGFLYHMSAAHLDAPTDQELNELLNTLTRRFLKKMGVQGNGNTAGG